MSTVWASSSSSASVAASANAWRCAGVRASSGTYEPATAAAHASDGSGLSPMSRRTTWPTHASSTTSATSRLIDPSVRMLLSRRNRATANSSVSQMFCTSDDRSNRTSLPLHSR